MAGAIYGETNVKKLRFILYAATLLILPISGAKADVTYTAGCTGGGSTLTCTYTALSPDLFIDSNIADLNVSGTVTNVTGTFSGGSGAGTTLSADFSGAQQVDGLGQFNITTSLSSGPGGNPTASQIVLTITGSMLALLANSDGNTFAAHVCDVITGSTCSSTFFSTPGTNNPPPPPPGQVPLPGAVWLFGTGVGLIGVLMRKRRKTSATMA